MSPFSPPGWRLLIILSCLPAPTSGSAFTHPRVDWTCQWRLFPILFLYFWQPFSRLLICLVVSCLWLQCLFLPCQSLSLTARMALFSTARNSLQRYSCNLYHFVKGNISHDFYRYLYHGFKILLAFRAPRVTKLSEEISRSFGSWVGRRIGTRWSSLYCPSSIIIRCVYF